MLSTREEHREVQRREVRINEIYGRTRAKGVNGPWEHPQGGRSSGVLSHRRSGLRTPGRPVLGRGDTPSTATHPGPGQGFPRPYLEAGRLCSPRQGRASALKERLRWPAGSSSSWPASSPSPQTSPARPRGCGERRVAPTPPSGRPQSAPAGAAEPLRSRGEAGKESAGGAAAGGQSGHRHRPSAHHGTVRRDLHAPHAALPAAPTRLRTAPRCGKTALPRRPRGAVLGGEEATAGAERRRERQR